MLVLRILGAALILLVLLDVFLTVLYARVGAGVFSNRLACAAWWTFRTLAKPFPRRRDLILSFCGPVILVLLVATWVFGLMCGGAMIIKPALSSGGIVCTSGAQQTDFMTALYIAGDSMTTVGTSDFTPRTTPMRLLYTLLSLLGLCLVTLTLTYFLQIYTALHARNTFAVKMHHASGGTGDAAELITGVGPHGQFQAGYTHLTEMAAEMIQLFENHHFYAVLLYFRFREPHYALARMALLTLDTVTLIKTTLDDREYAWLKESAALAQLWKSSMTLLTELAVVFLPGGLPGKDDHQEPDAPSIERWKRRYHVALLRLRQAGIRTVENEQAGAESYSSLRARWDRYLVAFAEPMQHTMDQIDPVGHDPGRTLARPDFEQRLRAAG
jgi:hypothetical protein